MEPYQDLTQEEIEELETADFQILPQAAQVEEGVCPSCENEMRQVVRNYSIYDGSITFHLISFRCTECEETYLDLEQAQKYDLYRLLQETPEEDLEKVIETRNIAA
jgi:transposase-like protein